MFSCLSVGSIIQKVRNIFCENLQHFQPHQTNLQCGCDTDHDPDDVYFFCNLDLKTMKLVFELNQSI